MAILPIIIRVVPFLLGAVVGSSKGKKEDLKDEARHQQTCYTIQQQTYQKAQTNAQKRQACKDKLKQRKREHDILNRMH